jgi:hypothetical protein
VPGLKQPTWNYSEYHMETGVHGVVYYDRDQFLCLANRQFGKAFDGQRREEAYMKIPNAISVHSECVWTDLVCIAADRLCQSALTAGLLAA